MDSARSLYPEMLWLKFLHIAGVAVWVAGLLYLAALLQNHQRVRDRQDFARVRMGSRFAYMGLVSPAAFVAVGEREPSASRAHALLTTPSVSSAATRL